MIAGGCRARARDLPQPAALWPACLLPMGGSGVSSDHPIMPNGPPGRAAKLPRGRPLA